MELIGWIVWILFVVWALYSLLVLLARNPHAAIDNEFSRKAVTTVSFLQCVVVITIGLAFLYLGVNKLHLLWLGPTILIAGMVVSFVIGKLGS